ncbi:MAG: glycosyltransferase family 9 protein [Bacteroidales bacterium]|nr:glycosyltransferase family 9 protein [Bacteroidales bacterium]
MPTFRRIALIKPSALGDIVHTLPVLTALRRKFPDATITWIVNQSYESLLTGHPHLTDTLAFERGRFRQGFRASCTYTVHFLNALRRRRFDLVIDLQGLLRTGLMTASTAAPIRVGFANAREGARWFYTHAVAVPDAETIHAVDRYWRVAEWLGAGATTKEFLLPVRPEEIRAAERELDGLPRPWLAMAVGSRWVTKQWPPEYFAELANRAFAAAGGSVILVGVANDCTLSQQVRSGLRAPALDLTGKTSLPRLTAILALADVMIANDTGPLHLAAALGRPCVAPYTCTKTVKHGPYGVPGAGVETTAPCGGSYLKRCPHGFRCFNDLTPKRLWEPLSEVLRSWVVPSRTG